MSHLYKTERVTVRLTAEQLGRLTKAAKIESRRKGELVDEGKLMREATMAKVEEILEGAESPAT